MPELPEVETTRRGVSPHVIGKTVKNVIVRQAKLRHPVSRGIRHTLPGLTITAVRRRAKYLLFDTKKGSMIIHLGMSGSLWIKPKSAPLDKHDHVDIEMAGGQLLRYHDPRRFGAVLWTSGDPLRHKLLRNLGPEPLAGDFDAGHLIAAARDRKIAIKNLIMTGSIVVGVGNIYASEALFRAGIHPKRAAGRIGRVRMTLLVDTIRSVLSDAITQGGTSLRDFTGHDGQPGYFAQRLDVYGRAGEPCNRCGDVIRQAVIGQRSSFYCVGCQT